MKKLILMFLAVLLSGNLFAQDGGVDMAEALRSNGHIYVVVICVMIILVGLLLLLFSIDRRLRKLEKK